MPTQEVVLKTVDSYHAITIRQVVPVPSDVGTLLSDAYMGMSANGIQPIGAPIAVFHDEEFKPTDMDVEIIFPVAPSVTEDITLDDGRKLVARQIPAMPLVASVIHTGNYSNLPPTYEAIGAWIINNGYRMAGPSLEIYLTAPDGDKTMTEIQFPVVKA